jgi:hypothetical protein
MTDIIELLARAMWADTTEAPLSDFGTHGNEDIYRSNVRALLAALDAAGLQIVSKDAWQPIKTAPLEPLHGVAPRILVWDGLSMSVAWHAWDEEGKPVFFDGDVPVCATHWQPLAAAPKP